MRYRALATDYDGTLAHAGKVPPETAAALRRWRQAGRKLLLVTGRRLDSLRDVFPQLDLFDSVVGENGAVLYSPQTDEVEPLHAPPSRDLIDFLQKRDVQPLAVGSVIIATREPYEQAVLDGIRELGLDHDVIFNKGAIMILPTGVSKTTGLAEALERLGLSRHHVVAVGDAENDYPFLEYCGLAVAVQDALPTLKERADYVTAGGAGAGIVELIDRLLEDDVPRRA